LNLSWSGDRIAFLLLVALVGLTVRALTPGDKGAGAAVRRLEAWLGVAASAALFGAWLWFAEYDFTERLLNSLALGFSAWFGLAYLLRLRGKLDKMHWFHDWGWSGFSAVWLALIIRALLMEVYSIPSESMVPTLLINDHVVVSKTTFGWHLPFTHGRVLKYRDVRRGEIVIFVPPNAPKQSYVKRCVGIPGDSVEVRDKQVYINGKLAEVPYSFGRLAGGIPEAALDALRRRNTEYLTVRRAELQALRAAGKDQRVADESTRTTWLGPIDVPGAGRYYIEAAAVAQRVYGRLVDKPAVGQFETLPKEFTTPEPANLDWARDHHHGNRDWFGPYKLAPDEYWMMGDNRDNSLDSRFFGPVKVEALRGTPLVRYWPLDRLGRFQ
jgi:signal peptidase I